MIVSIPLPLLLLGAVVLGLPMWILGRRYERTARAVAPGRPHPSGSPHASGVPFVMRSADPFPVFASMDHVSPEIEADPHAVAILRRQLADEIARVMLDAGAIRTRFDPGGHVSAKAVVYRLGEDGLPTNEAPPRPRVEVA